MVEKALRASDLLKACIPWLQGGVMLAFSIVGFFTLKEIQLIHTNRDDITVVQKDIAVMQGNRFTSRDGMDLRDDIAAIEKDVASIPREFPPVWFENRVDVIATDVNNNSEKLDTVLTMGTKNSGAIDGIMVAIDNLHLHEGDP